MRRQEKIKEAQELEKQINDLKRFFDMLMVEDTVHPNFKLSSVFVKKKISFSFLGLVNSNKDVEIQIPTHMTIEIASKTKQWIEELEKRANDLFAS